MKILITDDDRDYRAILYSFLHSKGHDVLAVSDALHAVALLADHSHDFDLVLLDLNMPRLSGEDLLHSYAHWRNCQTRFVVLSGRENLDEFAGHPRVAAILQKPFALSKLESILQAEASRCAATSQAAFAS